jgi:isoleucyl-tRNA synthetase
LVQRLVSLGRQARESVQIGVRQPLAEAMFVTRDSAEIAAMRKMSDLIGAELNVKSVRLLDEPTYSLNPLPQKLGKKLGKLFPQVQKLLRDGDHDEVQVWAKALKAGETVKLEVDGQTVDVLPEDVEVHMKAGEGLAFAEDRGYMAVIDTRLSDELVSEGLAREVVRRIQSMRRDAAFNVTDRITTRYQASDKIAKAIELFNDYIRTETLSEVLEVGESSEDFHNETFALDGENLTLGVRR